MTTLLNPTQLDLAQTRVTAALVELGINPDEIREDAQLRADLDVDSAELVEIVAAVAGVAPDGKALKTVRTVGDLAAFLAVTVPRQSHWAPARFLDLSVPTEASPSEATPVHFELLDHRAGVAVLGRGELGPDDFPDGLALSNETVTLTTHTGTHMDAPLHYGPRTGRRPARSIDQVPLDWCFGPGVRLDLRHLPPGAGISTAEVQAALDRIRHLLQPGDIVLLWTGADQLWGSPAYLSDYPGLTGEATRYLLRAGVRVIGIDAWGLDRPTTAMLDEYRRTGDRGVLWPAHLVGRDVEYLQLEKLANLGQLPAATGYAVSCFPVRIAGAGAGWTRVVAHLAADAP